MTSADVCLVRASGRTLHQIIRVAQNHMEYGLLWDGEGLQKYGSW